MTTNGKTAFSLGQIVATPGALQAIEASGQSPTEFVGRHAHQDWGDVCDEDKRLNDEAVESGERLLSAYCTSQGIRLWVITEAADDAGRRVATTILLPDEY